MENSFPMNWCQEEWFLDDSSTLHSLCSLLLLFLYQFHLRSSGMRSWRLGTPDLENNSGYWKKGKKKRFLNLNWVWTYWILMMWQRRDQDGAHVRDFQTLEWPEWLTGGCPGSGVWGPVVLSKEVPGNLMGTIWGFTDHLSRGCCTYIGGHAAPYTSIF